MGVKTNDVDHQQPANQDMGASLPATPFALVFTHLSMSLEGTLQDEHVYVVTF